jgi:hypothetical protein
VREKKGGGGDFVNKSFILDQLMPVKIINLILLVEKINDLVFM